MPIPRNEDGFFLLFFTIITHVSELLCIFADDSHDRCLTSERVGINTLIVQKHVIYHKKPDGGRTCGLRGQVPLYALLAAHASGAGGSGAALPFNRRGHLDGMDKGRAISTSIVEGMDWNQTFDAAKNARSSMCDKKLNTAKAGALTRRLVMALWPVEIADVACNATNGLWIEIKKDDSSSLKERLTGRFSIGDVREPQSGQLIVADGDEITASIANQIITLDIDKVHVRSILNCKCEHGICAKCYGALPSGELPPIGYPAGLIAAQSIGERGTQLSMQSFHGGDSITKRFAIFSRLFTDSVKQKTFEDFMKDIMAHDENNIYSKLEERHFIILYRALQGAGDKLDNVVSREKDGFLSWLVARLTDKGSRYQSAQMKRLLAGALGDCAPDKLISPVAKILFNFCGDRKMPCR